MSGGSGIRGTHFDVVGFVSPSTDQKLVTMESKGFESPTFIFCLIPHRIVAFNTETAGVTSGKPWKKQRLRPQVPCSTQNAANPVSNLADQATSLNHVHKDGS